MKRTSLVILVLIIASGLCFGQTNAFEKINFIIGEWSGTGSGFGNDKSKIESSFQLVMNDNYIEVKNESIFEPTEQKPEGEHHIDHGFISYEKSRDVIIFRQFHIEGFVTRYTLSDSLSDQNTLVFETDLIENFVPGGKARWTIKKISDNEIETTFDVSFPNKGYTCFGVNKLIKK